MNIEKEYPSVPYLEAAAKRRIPTFVHDFLVNGLGDNLAVRKATESLASVELMPRYLSDADRPDLRCRFLGREYDAPFGVAPMGMTGLVWPHAENILAQAAKEHNIPYILSTMASVTLEEIRKIGGEHAWFQLYVPKDRDVLKDLLRRCEVAGYDTVAVTVDVPYKTRRAHDIHNGLAVPLRLDLNTLWQIMARPEWALRMLGRGIPQFVNIAPYHDGGNMHSITGSLLKSTTFVSERMGLHITAQRFAEIRDLWPRTLLVKGVLDPAEAQEYMALGADGLIVSNHGGRQLDAAPSVVTVLPKIREAVGPHVPLIADGGVRSGLDIARMLALGADFVTMGRPFLCAVAALDNKGGDYIMDLLKAELQSTMGQLGCATLSALPSVLIKNEAAPAMGFPDKAHAEKVLA